MTPLLSARVLLPICVSKYPSLWIVSNNHLANLIVYKDEHGVWNTDEHVEDKQWAGCPYDSQEWDIGDEADKENHGEETSIEHSVSQSLGEERFLSGFADEEISSTCHHDTGKVCCLTSEQDTLLGVEVGKVLHLSVPPVEGALFTVFSVVDQTSSCKAVLVGVWQVAVLVKHVGFCPGKIQGVCCVATIVEWIDGVDHTTIHPSDKFIVCSNKAVLELI